MGGNLKQNCKLSEKKASGATLMTVGSAQFGWHWTPTAHLGIFELQPPFLCGRSTIVIT